jgi:hypothetical protein
MYSTMFLGAKAVNIADGSYVLRPRKEGREERSEENRIEESAMRT